MTIFEYVQDGDPLTITALRHNKWQDAARYVEQVGNGLRSDVLPVTPSSFLPAEVRNGTGGELNQYSVMTVSGPRWTDDPTRFKQQLYLEGANPSAGDQQLVVTMDRARAGQPVLCAVAGVVPVQLEMRKSGHKFARAKDGDATKLESCATGQIRIFAKTHTTGTDWAFVLLGYETPRRLEVELTTDINADASGTAKYIHDATETFTVWWDRRATSGKKLETGAKVDIEKEEGDSNDRWHIQKWTCEDEADQ